LPTTTTKIKRVAAAIAPVKPERHHLDKRAHMIAAVADGASDDELLSTAEMAVWFGTTEQWFEKARRGGYGPPYVKVGSQTIRYSRAKARMWLESRTRRSTAQYRKVKA
jgi:hypothetical protein